MNHFTQWCRGVWLITRMDKPIGIYLLLWPTLWALCLANLGFPPLFLLLIFVAGTVVMRAAGCVINDIADRKVDGHVKRTAQRPLISGLLTVKQAVAIFLGLLLCALLLVLQLNVQTLYLSFVAVALASIYPFMKRYTQLPQVVLGAAFSMAIPMAFMASNQSIPSWAWLLFGANLVWTVAYDTIYAMVDRDDDLAVGVKSTAILFGRYDCLAIVILQMLMLAQLVVVGLWVELGFAYWIAMVAAGAQCLWHQHLIKSRERQACFKAFRANHWVGLTILLGILVSLVAR